MDDTQRKEIQAAILTLQAGLSDLMSVLEGAPVPWIFDGMGENPIAYTARVNQLMKDREVGDYVAHIHDNISRIYSRTHFRTYEEAYSACYDYCRETGAVVALDRLKDGPDNDSFEKVAIFTADDEYQVAVRFYGSWGVPDEDNKPEQTTENPIMKTIQREEGNNKKPYVAFVNSHHLYGTYFDTLEDAYWACLGYCRETEGQVTVYNSKDGCTGKAVQSFWYSPKHGRVVSHDDDV